VLATGEPIAVSNGLEAFLEGLFLIALALVFTAYLFGVIINRLVTRKS